jgi:hypothetical protein
MLGVKLPDDWEMKTISNVADTIGGYGFAKKFQGVVNLPFPFVKVSDMNLPGNEIYIKTAANTVDNDMLDAIGARTYPSGTIIFPKIGGAIATNKKRILGVDATFDNNIMGILPNTDKVLVNWCFYYLLSVDLMDMANIGPVPSIRQSTLQEYPIPIPFPDEPKRSLAEQRRIVARIEALLAEVREMRALHDEIAADAGRLMDALRSEMFYRVQPLPSMWEMRSLETVAQINPRRPQIERDRDTLTSFVPMAAVDEVRGEFAQIESRPYGEVRSGFTYFEEDDVVFAKITPSMQNGKSAVARNLRDGIGFGTTEFHVIRSNGAVLPDWIHQFVRQRSFLMEATQHFRGAVGQQRVPPEFLASYIIPVPFPNDREKSLLIQQQLIERLKMAQTEVLQMFEDMEAEEALFSNIEQAILTQAFRGEL